MKLSLRKIKKNWRKFLPELKNLIITENYSFRSKFSLSLQIEIYKTLGIYREKFYKNDYLVLGGNLYLLDQDISINNKIGYQYWLWKRKWDLFNGKKYTHDDYSGEGGTYGDLRNDNKFNLPRYPFQEEIDSIEYENNYREIRG